MMSAMRLDEALTSWEISLRAEGKRPRTREAYLLAGDQLLDWLKNRSHGLDVGEISRGDIRSFIGQTLETRSAPTAKQRHSSLSILFKWLMTEGEIETSPMLGMSPPKVVDKPIPIVTQRHIDLLVDDCDNSFTGRRDEALIRVLWDTGLRVSELVGLTAEDVQLDVEILFVEGKGGKVRKVPFTVATTRSLDRYFRARRDHRLAHLDPLWIGERGPLTRNGVGQMLTRRSERVGIGHTHPHQFRHGLVDRLLSAGADEGSVMSLLGWAKGSRAMLDRYGAARQTERAFEVYRKLIG
jgi:site-specific recombinase XerD